MNSNCAFNCFGLVIHGYGADQVLDKLDELLKQQQQVMVVTANAEILLHARRDPTYWNILRQADLRLVDGSGPKIAGWMKGANPRRIAGVEFARLLVKTAAERGWKVALVGGGRDIAGAADKAAWALRQEFPNLQVIAESKGKVATDGSDDDEGAEARFRLTQFAPDILLVAYGHPKQEAWILRHLAELPSVKIAVGVGGTLDYWSGSKKRAPAIFRTLGLEWSYRLFAEPKRWKRIADAVIIFPLYFAWDLLRGK
ncbi:MAG: WecB/TagA/CpsF family glycosyltransferase [Patescibacteria group bacterium]